MSFAVNHVYFSAAEMGYYQDKRKVSKASCSTNHLNQVRFIISVAVS